MKIWRKLLVGMLGLALLYEVVFAAAALLFPEWTLGMAHLGVSHDALFLAYGLGWCLVFISLINLLCLRAVLRRESFGHRLADYLGYWWVLVGIAIYLRWGVLDNLFSDSLKGGLIAFFNFRARREA